MWMSEFLSLYPHPLSAVMIPFNWGTLVHCSPSQDDRAFSQVLNQTADCQQSLWYLQDLSFMPRPRKLSRKACWLSEWLKARIKGTTITEQNGPVIGWLFPPGSGLWLCLPLCMLGWGWWVRGCEQLVPAVGVSLSEEASNFDHISRMMFSKHDCDS